MSVERILCIACGEWISTVDLDTLRLPLDGSMFPSPRPENGFPPPFELDKTRLFGDLRCLICHNNATEEHAVMTTFGMYVVQQQASSESEPVKEVITNGKEESSATETSLLTDDHSPVCASCGKTLKSYAGRVAHERVCKAVPAPAPAHGDAEEEASRGVSLKDIKEASND
jgi:hypothetical protein